MERATRRGDRFQFSKKIAEPREETDSGSPRNPTMNRAGQLRIAADVGYGRNDTFEVANGFSVFREYARASILRKRISTSLELIGS